MKKHECRVCSGKDFDLIIDLGDQPWGNDFRKQNSDTPIPTYPLRLLFCKSCTTTQIDYTVKKEIMFGDHYYLSGTTKTLSNHFINVNQKFITQFNPNPKVDKILDIGGNDGTYLEYFNKLNYITLNVESSFIQSSICKKKRINCINDFFNFDLSQKIKSKYGNFKIIHGSGIFFHLEELKSVFNGIKNLLDPNKGVLIAEFIYLPEMIKNLAYDQIYHEHLLYYSLHSFQNLLNIFDLEIFDAYFDSIHGGSCIAYISHKKTFKKTNAILKYFDLEISKGILNFNTYQDFAKNVYKLKDKTVKLINKLNKEGKKIHALGAPVKGSTMINYLGFDKRNIECALEINDYKVGTFIPGTDIPVKHQDKMDYPDYYFLLSWNFKDEILSKLNKVYSINGKVIIPLPDLKII